MRAAYGGLQGDVAMLRRFSLLWFARHAPPCLCFFFLQISQHQQVSRSWVLTFPLRQGVLLPALLDFVMCHMVMTQKCLSSVITTSLCSCVGTAVQLLVSREVVVDRHRERAPKTSNYQSCTDH